MSDSFIYNVEITPEALVFIRTKVFPPNYAGKYALFLSNQGVTGGGYNFDKIHVDRVKNNVEATMICPVGYHGFDFPVVVEQSLIEEGYLPHSFIIVLVRKLNGTPALDLKNPEFET
jgi:hypothetical protein